METLKTEQPQGPSIAQAEPKDEEQTTGAEQNVMNSPREKGKEAVEMLHHIPYTARYQKEILTEALGRVNVVTSKIDELLKMENLVRKIYTGLDIKTKALICVLEKIAEVNGVTNDVTFGGDILHDIYRDKSIVEQASEELRGDTDIATLSEAFDLADFICREDYLKQPKPEASAETEPTDTEPITEQPQPAQETTTNMVKEWLLSQGYKTKLACVILSGYQVGDHNTERIADEIYHEFDAAVLDKANNPEGLSDDEIVMTGYAAETLVWIKNL